MSKKSFSLCAVTIALFLSCLNLSAYADDKIGVVDYKRIQDESKYAKKSIQPLEKKFKKWEQDKAKLQEQIQEKSEELTKRVESDTISQDEIEKEKEKLQSEIDRLASQKMTLQSEHDKIIAELDIKIRKVVEDVADDKDINIVIPQISAVYYNKSIDITKEVIKELDDK